MGYYKNLDIRIRNGGDDALAATLELLPQWISVHKQLPEQGVQVLVCWESQPAANQLSIAKFWGEKSECGKCLFWYDGYGAMYASHWMPLPEPPAQ